MSQFPGTFKAYYPIDPRLAASPGPVNFNLSTRLVDFLYFANAGDVWFPARTGTKTVSAVWFHLEVFSSLPVSPSVLRVSLQGLRTASLGPDGTPISGGTSLLVNPSLAPAWRQVTGMTATVSYGQKLAVVFDFDDNGALLSQDRFRFRAWQFQGGTSSHGYPWTAVAKTSSGTYVHQGVVPNVVLEFNDGTYGLLSGSTPITADSAISYLDTDSPNEYGLKFRVPFTCAADALWVAGSFSGDAETQTTTIVLSDAATGDLVAQAEIDEAEMSGDNRLSIFTLRSEVTLDGGSDYVVSLRPNNSANTATLNLALINSANWRPLMGGDTNMKMVSRTGSTTWSDYSTTDLPICGVRLSRLGSTGGGGSTHYGITAETNSYTLTGSAATFVFGRRLSADAGSYAVTGSTTGLTQSTKILVTETDFDINHYFYSGFTAVLSRGYALSANPGAYNTSGRSANLGEAQRLDVDAGSYAVTGSTATFTHARGLFAESGSYSVLGFTATLTEAVTATYSLSLDAGAYTVTGSDAGLTATRTISLDSASYVVTGLSATLLVGYSLSVDAGSYSLTGSDASLLATRRLETEPGAYIYSGSTADLDHTPVSAGRCQRSSAIWVSSPWRVNLPTEDSTVEAHDRRHSTYHYCASLYPSLSADSGSYSVTGSATTFLRGYALAADPGGYVTTGDAASLSYGYAMSADAGSYTLTGSDAAILAARILETAAGGYTVTGLEALLDLDAALIQYVLSVDPGSYAITGSDATFLRSHILSVDAGSYTVTGSDASVYLFQPGWSHQFNFVVDEIMEQ